jgi:hypothetical protein
MTRQLRHKFLIGVLLTTVLGSYCTASGKATEPTTMATVYEQNSQILGHCQLMVSKAGIRLNWKSKNIALISHPPEWRMVMLNPTEQKYFMAPPGQFRACSMMTASLYRTGDTSILKPRKTENTVLNGRTVKKISMRGEPALKTGDRNWQKLLLHSADYWIEPTTDIPPPVVRHIQEMYVLPLADGLPLQLITINNKSKIAKELQLLSVKTQAVSSKSFVIPSKYKPVKSQEELLDGGKSDDIIQLIPHH